MRDSDKMWQKVFSLCILGASSTFFCQKFSIEMGLLVLAACIWHYLFERVQTLLQFSGPVVNACFARLIIQPCIKHLGGEWEPTVSQALSPNISAQLCSWGRIRANTCSRVSTVSCLDFPKELRLLYQHVNARGLQWHVQRLHMGVTLKCLHTFGHIEQPHTIFVT